jgi:hypothetical protein
MNGRRGARLAETNHNRAAGASNHGDPSVQVDRERVLHCSGTAWG